MEKLEITFCADFDKAIMPPRMNDTKEFKVSALTKWKAEQKDEQTIEISQIELIKQNFLKLGIPEIK